VFEPGQSFLQLVATSIFEAAIAASAVRLAAGSVA